MMPEMTTAPASVKANSRNSEPVSPLVKPIGAYTAASVMRHGDRPAPKISRMPLIAASHRRHAALLDVAVDVLHHDDGVVDDEADGQHHGEQRQQVDRIAEREQHEADADQRQRDGDDRHQHRAERAEEEQDHHDDDGHRLGDRLEHLARSRRVMVSVES